MLGLGLGDRPVGWELLVIAVVMADLEECGGQDVPWCQREGRCRRRTM